MSTILLIDDDPVIFDLAKRILGRLGHKLLWAKNGEAALEMLAESDLPDLVLCDIMMPGMDGYETLQAIREDARLCHLSVAILTGQAKSSDLKWADEMGVLCYINKPFTSAELQRHVTRSLELKQLNPSD